MSTISANSQRSTVNGHPSSVIGHRYSVIVHFQVEFPVIKQMQIVPCRKFS
jgi:hypothetical protein